MNFELARAKMDAEIAEAERLANLPPVVTDETMVSDVQKIVDDWLIAKCKVQDMKLDHALLFGMESPYFYLL